MDILAIEKCSRARDTYDVYIDAVYTEVLERLRERVSFQSETPILAIFTYEGDRYSVQKTVRDDDTVIKLTVPAISESQAKTTATTVLLGE